MPTTHQRHHRNRPEGLRFHAAFQLFYRWHHSIYLAHLVFQVQIQIIPSECWFFFFDAMTSCLILQKCLTGDVTWAGRDVKMHCPPLRREMSNPAYYDTDFHHLPWQTHMFRYNVSASSVLQRVSNVGTWPAWRRTTDRQMKVDHPALRPTCCLCNALIRFTSKWTWHFDTKEFHSLHVRSSPYCINMPLMFHSDTGL